MPSFSHWTNDVQYKQDGPAATLMDLSDELKVVLVGLEPGQELPPHRASAGCFHFLEGTGQMIVGDDRVDVEAGYTVVVPAGEVRGVAAKSRLTFLGTLHNPAVDTEPAGAAAVARGQTQAEN